MCGLDDLLNLSLRHVLKILLNQLHQTRLSLPMDLNSHHHRVHHHTHHFVIQINRILVIRHSPQPHPHRRHIRNIRLLPTKFLPCDPNDIQQPLQREGRWQAGRSLVLQIKRREHCRVFYGQPVCLELEDQMVVHNDHMFDLVTDCRFTSLQTGPQPIIHLIHSNHHPSILQVLPQHLEPNIIQALHYVVLVVQGHLILILIVDTKVLVG